MFVSCVCCYLTIDNVLFQIPKDVFDAMVTGDLMEYTVHGSSHGGSSHGGSFHSAYGGSMHSAYGGSMHSMTGGSGSLHGFLTLRDDNEAPIISSASAPLVKSTFRQLGRVEDGWLIEMYPSQTAFS